jgi:hypothetical protein
MIRFVPLPSKTDGFSFAWLDASNNRFLECRGRQLWSTWPDFLADFLHEHGTEKELLGALATLFNEHFAANAPEGQWEKASPEKRAVVEKPKREAGSEEFEATLQKFRREAEKRKELLVMMRKML